VTGSMIAHLDVVVVDSQHTVRWTERAKPCAVTTTILRIVDSDGAEGVAGFDSYQFARADLSVLEAVRSMWPWLEGRSIDCRDALAEDMRSGVVFPFATSALALVDVALWDLGARRAGMPLWKLLGGKRERIPAYASLETMNAEVHYIDVVGRVRDQGIGAVKLHAFGDPQRDVHLFEELRNAYPNLVFMHDAEGVYSRQEALRVAHALENLECRWFEAPLPDFDLEGYRDLRRRTSVPILPAGYAMWDIRQMAEALREPPWTAARADLFSTLGITALCRQIMLAQAFDMDFEPVSYGHALSATAALHVMLAFPNVRYFELAYPPEPWEYGVMNPIRSDSSGVVAAPAGAGLGLVLDWEEIEARTVQHVCLGD